jgi:uncharacterized protein YpbB
LVAVKVQTTQQQVATAVAVAVDLSLHLVEQVHRVITAAQEFQEDLQELAAAVWEQLVRMPLQIIQVVTVE